jgi:hypothetical protein
MSRSTDVHAALSQRITCAPGTVTAVTAKPGQLAQQLKLVTGGTLEIGGSTGAQAAIGASFNQMYYLSANEIYSWNNAGTLYLWASGATCVVALIDGRSSGDW